ncbi:MAG: HU family DNA-binding protein [Dysgonamonadaceae bacterium]|jgi:nucleoid DNA-binding protein|nr:HU family DNA-binding protein [Dysgonamonadaceae bacterium]
MNEKINIQELITLLAQKSNIARKEAESFLKEFFDTVSEALLEEQLVKIKNLGTFKLAPVSERESVDVASGERVLIPAHYKITFTPDSSLAQSINEPFSYFEPVELNSDSPLEDSGETIVFCDDDDSQDESENSDFELIVEDAQTDEIPKKEKEQDNNNQLPDGDFQLILDSDEAEIEAEIEPVNNNLNRPIDKIDKIKIINENIRQNIDYIEPEHHDNNVLKKENIRMIREKVDLIGDSIVIKSPDNRNHENFEELDLLKENFEELDLLNENINIINEKKQEPVNDKKERFNNIPPNKDELADEPLDIFEPSSTLVSEPFADNLVTPDIPYLGNLVEEEKEELPLAPLTEIKPEPETKPKPKPEIIKPRLEIKPAIETKPVSGIKNEAKWEDNFLNNLSQQKKKFKHTYGRWLYPLLYLVAFIAICGVFYYLFNHPEYGGKEPVATTFASEGKGKRSTLSQEKKALLINSDSAEIKKDTVHVNQALIDSAMAIVERIKQREKKQNYADHTSETAVNNKPVETKLAEMKSAETKPVETKPAETKPVETQPKVTESRKITVQNGHTLASLALKEYGNKCFWIYIYEENKKIIRNPNTLQLGLTLTIPPAEKYGINKDDPESVKQANMAAMREGF